MPEKGYRIHLVGRISVQYYLIKYRGHYYLLDYADPKKFSSYGARGLAVKAVKEWTIYNVDADRKRFFSMINNMYFNEKKDKFSSIILVLVLLLGVHLLQIKGVSNNGHSDIFNFILGVMFVVVGLLSIVFILKSLNKRQKIDVSQYEKSLLRPTNVKWQFLRKVLSFIIIYFILFIFIGIGTTSSTLWALILFSCTMCYITLFCRFVYFMLNRQFPSMGFGDTYMLFKRVKE
ncbi:hypothetical protein [Bombilactobacillus thymidiniphilus]|uniref:DUF443 family protein n=1 Tax=Bombilactobacillus thymidiniphilus TaxID=2923363 RepID=A0ABY4PEE0_9LACO|nr:hypothetical protein [Bombilactobacillus thymidiniphilus]UQS84101.1 hypothetical protein MOO47_02815 [Bombilactobacillus thymidiniphilus]